MRLSVTCKEYVEVQGAYKRVGEASASSSEGGLAGAERWRREQRTASLRMGAHRTRNAEDERVAALEAFATESRRGSQTGRDGLRAGLRSHWYLFGGDGRGFRHTASRWSSVLRKPKAKWA